MKGIILAGGAGTRMYPITKAISKQIIPVYDKPMIYYPLSVLMLAGIREILVISTPSDIGVYKFLLEDGSKLGLDIKYAIQEEPNGLAQAFPIAAKNGFFHDRHHCPKDTPVCLILGDNIFHGQSFTHILEQSARLDDGAIVFGYWVKDPQRYGVVEFDWDGKVLSLEEKPILPKSNYAVTGLYFYGSSDEVCGYVRNMKPSARGEYEITDLNRIFARQDRLFVHTLGRGFAWLDTGTHDSLLEAANYIKTVESRQGLKIACIEEIAFTQKYIDETQFKKIIDGYKGNPYGEYLKTLLN